MFRRHMFFRHEFFRHAVSRRRAIMPHTRMKPEGSLRPGMMNLARMPGHEADDDDPHDAHWDFPLLRMRRASVAQPPSPSWLRCRRTLRRLPGCRYGSDRSDHRKGKALAAIRLSSATTHCCSLVTIADNVSLCPSSFP
jgi:hypothetical protein